jgi:tripartite ATP-independent transporter DctP family solute receptor
MSTASGWAKLDSGDGILLDFRATMLSTPPGTSRASGESGNAVSRRVTHRPATPLVAQARLAPEGTGGGTLAWTAAAVSAGLLALAMIFWLTGLPASLVAALAAAGAVGTVTGLLWLGSSRALQRNLELARRATPELSATAHRLSNLADAIAGGAQGQASRVGEVAAAVEELSASVVDVARHADHAADSVTQSVASTEDGFRQAREAIAAIRRVAASLERSAVVIQKLEETQGRIAAVVNVIRQVANETNLLALNAAVEAARAGQHGAAFAVVAGEVRDLANRTKTATGEITAMVTDVVNEIGRAADTVRGVGAEVDAGVRLVTASGEHFGAIRDRVAQMQDAVAQIAQAATQQSSATRDIARAMEALTAASHAAAGQASTVSQASQTLTVLADEMGGRLQARHSALVRRGRSRVLRLVILEQSTLVARAALRMADRIETASGGRLRVERIVDESLGERDMIAQLRRGEAAFSYSTAAVLSNYVPALQVLLLPYAFGSYQELFRVVDGPLGRKLVDRLRPLGLLPLGFLEHGPRHFTGRRPIRQPGDLRGMSMRIQESAVGKAFAHALGANPRALSRPEWRRELERGTIDASDNTVVIIADTAAIRRHHPYITLDAHCFSPTVLLFSEAVFRELSPDLQAIVEQAAREAIAWQRQANVTVEPELVEKIRREGATLIELAPADREAFVRATRIVWEQFEPVVGSDVMAELLHALGRG